MAGLRENSSIGWRNRGSDEALVGNSSSGWRFLVGCIAFSVRFVPMTGGFWPLVGPSAGGSFHLLEESGLQQSVQREDSSSGWMNRDDERLVWARIVPVSGGFGTVDGGFGLWMACWREESSSVWRDLPGETAFGVLLFQWVGDLGL